MRLLIRAKIGDDRPTAVGIYPDDRVRNARHAVRTSGTGENCVHRVTDKRDVPDATGEAASLAGWQAVHEGRNVAVGIDLRNARSGRTAKIISWTPAPAEQFPPKPARASVKVPVG